MSLGEGLLQVSMVLCYVSIVFGDWLRYITKDAKLQLFFCASLRGLRTLNHYRAS